MWADLAATETHNANLTARFLVLAIFAGLAWLAGHTARRRKHSQARLITMLGFGFLIGLIVYIVSVRPVARWSIWYIAGIGYGVLLVWAYGGGSEPKSD